MSIYMDTLRRVVLSDGHFVEVAPWPEAPGVLVLRTTDESSKDYFGAISLTMTPEFANKLADALRACATEVAL